MKDGTHFDNSHLSIDVKETGKTLTLTFHGKSIERTPGEFLVPIFKECIEEPSLKTHNIEFDMRDLEYINSSTITIFARLLENAKNEVKKLSILYKSSVRWQRLCFEALKIFETQTKNIQIIGK